MHIENVNISDPDVIFGMPVRQSEPLTPLIRGLGA